MDTFEDTKVGQFPSHKIIGLTAMRALDGGYIVFTHAGSSWMRLIKIQSKYLSPAPAALAAPIDG